MVQGQSVDFFWQVVGMVMGNWIMSFIIVVELWSVCRVMVGVVCIFLFEYFCICVGNFVVGQRLMGVLVFGSELVVYYVGNDVFVDFEVEDCVGKRNFFCVFVFEGFDGQIYN